MPVNMTPGPNMVLLNRILQNQEMIIAKINGLKDDMTKLELTTNNILCKTSEILDILKLKHLLRFM